MKSFTKCIALFTIILSAFCFNAFADSFPQRQIRISIFQLMQTPTGHQTMEMFKGNGDYAPIFTATRFSSLSNKHLYATETGSLPSFKLMYNAGIVMASPRYISWILSQALFDISIDFYAHHYGISDIPEFVELSVWKTAEATFAWNEMGGNSFIDYCYDKKYSEVATQTNSCPSHFSELLGVSLVKFQKAVVARNILMGVRHLSLEKAIDNSTGKRKEFYIHLLNEYKEFVKNRMP